MGGGDGGGESSVEGQHAGVIGPGLLAHLVAGADVLELLRVDGLRDVRGLLLDGHNHVARAVVQALVHVVVTNVLEGLADHLLVVDVGGRRDLTEDHHHARLSATGKQTDDEVLIKGSPAPWGGCSEGGNASGQRRGNKTLVHVSQATRDTGSSRMHASSTASDTWSQILSARCKEEEGPHKKTEAPGSKAIATTLGATGWPRLARTGVTLVDRLAGEEIIRSRHDPTFRKWHDNTTPPRTAHALS